MSIPGTVVEKGGNLYRVDQETYVYYDTAVTEQTKTDYTGFDDVSICRPKLLYFKAVGLRPNTRHFVYFDKVDVSNYINTSISNVTEFRNLARNDPKRNPGEKYIQESGFPTALGGPTTPILSDASGTIEGVFYLQSNNILSFPAGRRIMSFIDINILDPESALSFATATFTVDAGIENYATSYYTTSSQVRRTGTKNNLTFIAPVIKEAVINNITNEYVTEITNEYVTNNYVTNVNNINNTYVPGPVDNGTKNTTPVVVKETKGRDEGGTSGGKTTPGGGVCIAEPISKSIGNLTPPSNIGAGKNNNATSKGISVSATAAGNGGAGAKATGNAGVDRDRQGPNNVGAGNTSSSGSKASSGSKGATPGGGGGTGGPGNVGGKSGAASGAGGNGGSKGATGGASSGSRGGSVGPR